MKTSLLKRLRREADNLYSIFPTCKIYNNQMKMVWQVCRLLGMVKICYFESEDDAEAKEMYDFLKRENILYQVKYLRNKQIRKL